MPVRMKDIAKDLNVSVVTVSKVLRNHSDISPAMKQRVLQRMKELNYQPNWTARSLVTGKTFMIGLIVPDLVHPFFAEVAKGLSKVIREKGYSLVISSSEEDPELEIQEITFLPQATKMLSGEDLALFERFLGMLNDCDDVQEIYHNVSLP